MSAYLNEEEQLEAIRRWWRENGRAVIGGVVLGLAVIFGWQGWRSWQQGQAETASALYDELVGRLRAGEAAEGLEAGKRLLGEYPGTVYADFAALEMARALYEQGKTEAAGSNLQWVVDNAEEPLIAALARVRLAALRLDGGQTDAAATLLDGVPEGFMPARVAELRGDLARARGDLEAARAAYDAALALADVARVRLKRAELGDGGAS